MLSPRSLSTRGRLRPHDARLLRNGGLNLAANAIGPAAALIALPITFRALGPERFALLGLIWAILTYATLLDFGIGRGVTRAGAAALAAQQPGRMVGIARLAALFQFAIGVVGGLVLLLLVPAVLRVLRVPLEYQAEMTGALRVVAASLPLLLINQSQQGVLEALERFDLLAWVRSPLSVATYLLPALGAVQGWSLAQIALSIVLARVAATAALFGLQRALLRHPAASLTAEEIRDIARFGGWLSASVVVIGVMTYLDRVLLAGLGDLDMVAQYTVAYDLTAKLLIIPASMSAAYFPFAARTLAAGRSAAGVDQVRRTSAIIGSLLLLVSVILVVLAPRVLGMLFGLEIGPTAVACFRILAIATVLHASAFVPVVFIEAAGRAQVVAKYHLVELPVYAALLAVCIQAGGATGAAWAWLARSAWLAVWSHTYLGMWDRSQVNRIDPATTAIGLP